MKYSINDLAYGGKYHNQCWNPQFNKEATIPNALANCTAAVIAFCLIENKPLPVSVISDASSWHKYLTNGWRCIDFDPSQVKVGDVIQWVGKCHVCQVADIVDGTIYINGSFYTGEHGVAYYNGKYDTRNRFTSLQDLSNFMTSEYPTRFYHYWTLDKESQMTGGMPEHILVCPETVSPVERNTNANQIQTTDEGLRIRTEPSLNGKIVGHVQIGYYNVLQTREADDYTWYEIANDRWCADVSTIYLPKEDDIIAQIQKYFDVMKSEVNSLTDENAKLKKKLKEIADIVKD